MVEDSRTVDRPDTNELKVESLAKLWTGKKEKTKTYRKIIYLVWLDSLQRAYW